MFGTALFAALAALLLAACWIRARFMSFRGQSPRDYEGLGPEFDLRRHLNGPLVCEGVIFGPAGRIASRFTAEMEGRWDGDRGTVTERFRYDSGATQEREWRVELTGPGRFRAEADDLVGDGRGRTSGPGVQLRYRIRLPRDAGGHVLDTTDWMYLCDDGAIINRSQFRKYGITVGELVATLRPKEVSCETRK